MEGEEYTVRLDLFEGPLDLLLFLIRKSELDIYDIPIAVITEQYLRYLDLMKSLNVNLAADFLSMAATLVHIKSRMLLPSSPADDEDEDPRMEIVRPLLEYLRIKEAAAVLEGREILNRDVFTRDFPAEELEEFSGERELVRAGLFDLLAAFKAVMEQHAAARNLRLPGERLSVQEAMEKVMSRLRSRSDLPFTDLFEGAVTRSDLVATFLAVLELTKMGVVRVFQTAVGGDIRLSLNPEQAGGTMRQ